MQTEAELRGSELQAQGRVDSVRPYMAQPVSYPSLMGAALRVGADSFSAYNSYTTKTPKVPTRDAGYTGAGSREPGYGYF